MNYTAIFFDEAIFFIVKIENDRTMSKICIDLKNENQKLFALQNLNILH
jgi:hypothetical protein